ncbi:cbb3-type cytochrome oxidase subunit 3 [Pelistega europaea]|uniref:Cbb3-type cytochrome c oxidase subunit 3 n=1 Tax=Pelistega europaea TaxID=106147 RepID=A0A7Y4L9U3_9BURK|nr:cbb3-type cytochrome c oxidase subunit 3 [Pelistega europaea]NOL49538.1 cbb3-type cytochrome c oxidase subunit 3 [Pelistega europaea]
MAFLNGLSTIISMAVFLGIVWWAWSKGRAKANEEAAQLPFSLPDEEDLDVKNREVKS